MEHKGLEIKGITAQLKLDNVSREQISVINLHCYMILKLLRNIRPGANSVKLLQFTDFCNKLERLSLASLSNLV